MHAYPSIMFYSFPAYVHAHAPSMYASKAHTLPPYMSKNATGAKMLHEQKCYMSKLLHERNCYMSEIAS